MNYLHDQSFVYVLTNSAYDQHLISTRRNSVSDQQFVSTYIKARTVLLIYYLLLIKICTRILDIFMHYGLLIVSQLEHFHEQSLTMCMLQASIHTGGWKN